ncbi:unnamed protein product [Prunus armeniaca]
MDERTYNLIGADYPGNRAEDVKNPSLWWMTGFLFVVSFLGLFSLVPLRKLVLGVLSLQLWNCLFIFFMILRSWFWPEGSQHMLKDMLKPIALHNWLQHIIEGSQTNPTYVGCGLICSHIVSCSLLFGAILSWGFLWPLISQYSGDWYPADLGSNDLKGLYGYKNGACCISYEKHLKVFIAIALVLRDGLYNLVKIIVITLKKLCKKSNLPAVNEVLAIGLFIIASLVGRDGGVIAGRVNVDGAWRKDARIGGTVVIIRDCTGNFVAAGAHQIRNVECPDQIEALALLDGLRLAASLDHDLFHFESDSLKTTTAVLKGGANFSLLGRIYEDCTGLLSNFHSVSLNHVPRTCNSVADYHSMYTETTVYKKILHLKGCQLPYQLTT